MSAPTEGKEARISNIAEASYEIDVFANEIAEQKGMCGEDFGKTLCSVFALNIARSSRDRTELQEKLNAFSKMVSGAAGSYFDLSEREKLQ